MIPACTPRDHCGDGDDHNGHSIPVGIKLVHRIVEGIAVAVRPNPALLHLESVGLEEQPQFGVVVAGVEIEAGSGKRPGDAFPRRKRLASSS